MNSLEASIRENTTKGQLSNIRNSGNVPAIIYGGKEENQKITISKKLLKNLIEKENFLSSIISLNINGKPHNVLPREVKYDIISDECLEINPENITSVGVVAFGRDHSADIYIKEINFID